MHICIVTYDANGNLTSITNNCGTTNYTWNVRNQLTAINGFVLNSSTTCTAVTASFKYDALGRRIEKTINGVTTRYLYDGLDIIQERNASNAVTANYIRTLNIDEPLTRITGSTMRHYVTDALGSVIALTDDTGSVRTTYTYDPFGNTTISGESSDNLFQYTGRENDGTGLYYYRARYYSPDLQRFISEDPIGLAGGDVNFYAYVGNNPVNWVDPLGLKECKNKPEDCFQVFLNCMGETILGPGWSTFTMGAGAAAEHYYISKAWQHSANRGLSYPLRSSIVRGYLSLASKSIPVMTLITIIGAEFQCLYEEIQCLNDK